MFDFEIAQKAIQSLEEEFGTLPSEGFLAGGALANRMYQLKWGVELPVNDIDIFHFDSELLNLEVAEQQSYIVEDKKLFHADCGVKYITDFYGNYFIRSTINRGYIVKECYREQIFNLVKVKSSHPDPNLILSSFDLNCTQVGYDLKSKKFYYTPEWNEFLVNKQILVTAAHTPAHTILRIFKKCEEFKLPIIADEIFLLKECLAGISRSQRRHFTHKYLDLAHKYHKLLEENCLKVEKDNDTSTFLSTKTGTDIQVWTLKVMDYDIFRDSNLKISYGSYMGNLSKLLWAYRNIVQKDESKIEYWEKLHFLYNTEGFLEMSERITTQELKLYSKIYNIAPNATLNIKDNNIQTHLDYLDRLFEKFDSNVAVALLLNNNNLINWEDSDELLMELSVRILSNNLDIVKRSAEIDILRKDILYIQEEK